MEGDNTTAEESTGTSSEIQGHYEKHEKFVRTGHFLSKKRFRKSVYGKTLRRKNLC